MGDYLHDRLMTALGNMSNADLDTLQNDRIGKFIFPQMPSILKPYFSDWLNDYGPGETGMSHERIHATYREYYEHIAHDPESWEPQEVQLAKALLNEKDPYLTW